MEPYESTEVYQLLDGTCREHDWACVRLAIGTKEYHLTKQQAVSIAYALYKKCMEAEGEEDHG
jgi:hypothetical protein